MNSLQKIILVVGIIIIAILYFLIPNGFVVVLMGIVILGVVLMSIAIYNTSSRFSDRPEMIGRLSDDAKSVIIYNKGNRQAQKIHVALVPFDIEFDVETLDPERTYQFEIGKMLTEVKLVITYEDAKGATFSEVQNLSALAPEGEDLLKPMFPMFQWK